MSIEGGGGLGGGVGAAIAAGPAVNIGVGIEGMGIAGAAPVSGPIFGETPAFGAVSFTSLEGSVPMGKAFLGNEYLIGDRIEPSFNMGAEIVFRPMVEMTESNVLAEAENIIAKAQAPDPKQVLPLFNPEPHVEKAFVEPVHLKQPAWEVFLPQPLSEPQIEPRVLPFVHPIAYPRVEPKSESATEVKTQTQPDQRVAPETKPLLKEQEKEEERVEQETIVKKSEEVPDEEEIKKKVKKFVLDKATLRQRLSSVESALPAAKEIAERLGYGKKIIGWILGKLISLSQQAHLSKVVRPQGPDGTIPIIRETIIAKKEFKSEKEVEAVVLENRPVSLEDEGESVTNEEVRKVLRERMVKAALT